MIEAITIMGGLGVIVGVGLAVASKIFYVYVDPLILEIDDVLPGANCGGCGYPGCTSNAEAIAAGKSAPNSCVAAGSETAEAIAAILGVAIEAKEPDIARPGCYFGPQDADLRYIYDGLGDCRAAAMLGGGMKICNIGCLGLGSCAKACPFNAITMGPDNLPVVDAEKCTGCGTCERVCPKHIITLSSVTRRILRDYSDDECTTPCQRECPAGIDIREYIRQIQMGDYLRAVQVIKERNPFPTVIGRICPRPCEDACRRGMADEPVAINFLKRFAADYEKSRGQRILPYKAPETGKKMAVVGGGVEGLSAAFFSARLGHDVILYEATDRLGGLLRTAIAPERLSEEILDWDIDGIREMGVDIRTGMSLGKEITVQGLLAEGYEAVFTATGGWDNRLIRIGGSEIEGLVPGVFLVIDFIKSDTGRSHTLPPGDSVVIAGGGKSSLDAAKMCWDLGSERITVIFRESRESLPPEASALLKELEEDADLKAVFNAGISQIRGEDDQLSDIEYLNYATGEKTVIEIDNLYLGTGRFPEMVFYRSSEDTEEGASDSATGGETSETVGGPVRWTAVPPLKKPDFREETVIFGQGDVITDYSAAIRAIGAGRRSAASVHRVMYGLPLEHEENVLTSRSSIQNVNSVENVRPLPRRIMPVAGPKELAEKGELELGFTEQAAVKEAGRCLQCGLICYEKDKTAVRESSMEPAA